MRIFVSILLSIFLIGIASAMVLEVPTQYSTIQAGIDAASNGDTVKVLDGTYTGIGNKNLDFGGRLIKLISANGPENCIIDCQRNGRGFYFHTGETAEAEVVGITVKYGYSSNGGALFCSNASPTFKNCVFAGSQASVNGGGCYFTNGSPALLNCTVYGNTATQGGAIYSASNLTVNSCIISGNQSAG